MTEEQQAAHRKLKEEDKEQQRLKDLQAKQKINDGISLTQGDIKKTEPIDWDTNDKLNLVTKKVLNMVK
jgi:hypothetical protein